MVVCHGCTFGILLTLCETVPHDQFRPFEQFTVERSPMPCLNVRRPQMSESVSEGKEKKNVRKSF